MTIAAQLDQAAKAAGLNITGVRLVDESDKSTWQIMHAGKPTAADLAAAQAVIAAFDLKAGQATAAAPPPTLGDLVALLVSKGVLTPADAAQLTTSGPVSSMTLLV